jgi:M6 family metalloprotease-like protein
MRKKLGVSILSIILLTLPLFQGVHTLLQIDNVSAHPPQFHPNNLNISPHYCKGYHPQNPPTYTTPILGNRSLLIILIEFKDHPHHHDTSHYDQILWGKKPSVKDYFDEVSYGQFTYSKAGILGWYTSTYSIDRWETNLPLIAQQAYELARNDRDFSFSQYDKNNDKKITYDELSIIIGTSGEQSSRPSFAYYTDTEIKEIQTWDGVTLQGPYAIIQEWFPWYVYAHELGHSLGLPDLYDYPSAWITGTSYGIGPYDIMCLGTGHLSAWCKIKLGWITPIIVEDEGYYDIHAIETHPEAYILRNHSHSPREYFLIENRWQKNNYDEIALTPLGGLPDEGIVIYHIDESRLETFWGGNARWPNSDNNDETHKLVDLECADMPSSHYKNADHFDAEENMGDHDDLWKGDGYQFHDDSYPCNARWYNGKRSDIAFSVFSQANETIRVYVSLNGSTLPCDIKITYPIKGKVYISGRETRSTFLRTTLIMGPITIAAAGNATSKVEFYVDNQLKYTRDTPPYKFPFDEKIYGRHILRVVAYDEGGNNTSDELPVWIINNKIFPIFLYFLYSYQSKQN